MIIIKWKTKPILTEQFRSKIDRIFSLLGTGTSIKSGEVILVLWIQTSLVGEMILSFQFFPGVFYVRVNANPQCCYNANNVKC